MSRLTGTDAYSLMEAYSAVYAPQELTEEQVWEEVETWVNALIEEGYDLSDYTWEEMYESYINEDLIGDLRANAGNIKRGLSGAYQGAMKTASNVNQAVSDRMQRNIKPITTAKPSPKTFQSDSGGSTGFGRYGEPTQFITPKKVGPKIVGPKIVGPKIVGPGPTPPPRQQAPAAPVTRNTAPATRNTAPAGLRPTPTATTTPAPSTPRAKDSSITDMIGRSQLRQGAPINTGNKSSDARTIATGASVGSFQKPSASTPARPMGGGRERMLRQSFDLFDVIKGHLIDEGYADTEESALVIMANMSEEWRESIMEAGRMHSSSDQQVGFARIRSGESGGRGKKPMDDEEIENQPGGTEFLERIKKTKKNPKYKK